MPAMSSRCLALGLVLMACSDGSRGVPAEECRQITGRLADWRKQSPLAESFAHRSALGDHGELRLAEVDWARPLTRSAGIDADNLVLLGSDELPPEPLYVFAGGDNPMSRLEGLARDVSPAGGLRLLVIAPAAARAELHLRSYPRTPGSTAELIRRGAGDRDALWAAVESAGRGCAGVDKALGLFQMGAGVDVVGPGVAEALAGCSCAVADIDGFESLLAYAIVPNGDLGWLPLRYERGAPPLPGLGEMSSVGELIAALVKRPPDQRDQPIGFVAITDFTPQPAPRGLPPSVLTAPPPPPPPAAGPKVVAPSLLEAQRISGTRDIAPDAKTRAAIVASGKQRAIAVAKVCLDAAGAVARIQVLKASGFPAWDEAIDAGVRAWKFEPFMVDGAAAPVCSAVTFLHNAK
jgi:TonB family protein